MIIALEGAPATGKSSIGRFFAERRDGVCIEEVNKLFVRPKPEPDDWYLERELERLTSAKLQVRIDKHVVLAGDPYQPIWFNWCYPESGFAPWTHVLEFFEDHVPLSYVPDFYGFLTASPEVRLRRELEREADRGHGRVTAEAKYARYAQLEGPLRALFTAMGSEFPGFVLHVEPGAIAQMASELIHHNYATPAVDDYFVFMRRWLSTHNPSDFKL